jgi:hypothetical protein
VSCLRAGSIDLCLVLYANVVEADFVLLLLSGVHAQDRPAPQSLREAIFSEFAECGVSAMMPWVSLQRSCFEEVTAVDLRNVAAAEFVGTVPQQ